MNATVKSARNGAATGVLPVQTFRTLGGVADPDRVGGEDPAKSDAAANTGTQLLADLTTAGATPQSVATVTLNGTTLTDLDFGFNFSTIVNTHDAGQGSLRQLITNANALPNLKLQQDASSNAGGTQPAAGVETSIFMVPDGAAHPGLRSGLASQLTDGVARISLNTAVSGALPAFTDGSTSLDGTTQTLNIGNTNNVVLGTGGPVGTAATSLSQLNGPEVALVGTPGQANAERGLTLAAAGSTVRGLAIVGFGNTAANPTGADIYVTGAATSGTVITGNVLGASSTSFTDPGASQRSTGNGIYLADLNGGFVSATIANNLIGFHAQYGIDNLAYATPTSLLIENNEIRTNGLGNAVAGGLRMGNYGGTVRANLLADNAGAGLDAQGTTGNVTVADNTLSSNGMAGTLTPGIRLAGAANLVQHNLLNGNYGAGVMATPGASNNVISQNSIFDNGTKLSWALGAPTGQVGIDLLSGTDDAQRGTASYVSLDDDNDPDTGANGMLNFPVITLVTVPGSPTGQLEITGFAPAGALLEFFVADLTTATFGQGKTYLLTLTEGGAADLDATTGAYSGPVNELNQGAESNASRFLFRVPLTDFSAPALAALLAPGARLTATATSASGSGSATSEFSGSAPVTVSRPLPVQLTGFQAQAAGADAHLSWRTVQEVNHDHFVVERRVGTDPFSTIALVRGQGTTTQPHAYELTDVAVAAQYTNQLVYYPPATGSHRRHSHLRTGAHGALPRRPYPC